MSSLMESFNILQVDEETKQIVQSFMSHCQHKYLSSNKLLRIIPDLVTHICILYYYRTHSIYEWKVTENPQLTNIKHAVPGQSFNHHFKLHKLDWFLKFYPNGTKQSKQGNVFLLLYLRSTPEISRMSATCKVWLVELDKGREHYKDFNDKNKYTGWRSGLVKTQEIEGLDKLTFQVTIQIFEIYDKDGNNVTNKYIGLGIDSKQTITYLRKELQYEKAKVQRLTIEVDELSNRLLHGDEHDMDISNGNDIDCDDEKSMDLYRSEKDININIDGAHDQQHQHHHHHHVMYSPKGLSATKDDICNVKFEKWLTQTVKLGQYLMAFKKARCNDIRMIEFFDEESLEKDIGIKTKIHRRFIMKKATEFRLAQNEFVNHQLQKNEDLKQIMEQNGILSMKDLKDDIKTKQDVEDILGFDKKHVHYDMVWQLIMNNL